MREVKFLQCNLQGAIFGIDIPSSLSLNLNRGSLNLIQANFSEADCRWAKFLKTNVTQQLVNFSECDLRGADLTGFWGRTSLDLAEADLRGARLTPDIIRQAGSVKGTKFSVEELQHFSDAQLGLTFNREEQPKIDSTVEKPLERPQFLVDEEKSKASWQEKLRALRKNNGKITEHENGDTLFGREVEYVDFEYEGKSDEECWKKYKENSKVKKKIESSWQETVEKGNGIAKSVVTCP